MPRAFRPALLLTFTACSAAPAPQIQAPPQWRGPSGPVTRFQQLNPRDEEDREIQRDAKGGCFIWTATPSPADLDPTLAVPCPGPMVTDPAWAACSGGNLHVQTVQPLECACSWMMSNPPRPSETAACPAETITRAR